jgi:DNA ligase-1
VLLANTAPKGISPVGFYVSEKFDGVRALWDGSHLRFRSGRRIAAPNWFTDKLPATALDGELWMGRGTFDALSGIVRKNAPDDADWRKVQYLVFEAPQAPGVFAQRVVLIQKAVASAQWPQLRAVEQWELPNAAALQAKLKAITRAGGEGLMLHRADAGLVTGRSDVLLKLKAVQDAEAVVLAHVAGKGKYTGMLGALDVRAEDGHRFLLGTGFTDAQRRNPPAVGSTVTFAYRARTSNGVPRFASFIRVFAEP